MSDKLHDFINDLEEFERDTEAYETDEEKILLLLSEFILDIVDLRRRKNISQKELAEIMGTKQTSISRFENLNTNPKINYLYKITKALGENLYISPFGNYSYTIPLIQQNEFKAIAKENGNSPKEELKELVKNHIENNKCVSDETEDNKTRSTKLTIESETSKELSQIEVTATMSVFGISAFSNEKNCFFSA